MVDAVTRMLDVMAASQVADGVDVRLWTFRRCVQVAAHRHGECSACSSIPTPATSRNSADDIPKTDVAPVRRPRGC